MTPLDPAEVIDRNLSRYQIGVFALCGLIILLDGIDTQVIGIGAPLIGRELGIEPAAFGWVFSAAMLGATLGALACGVIADRLGRKTVLIVATTVFGGFTLATTLATDLTTLLLYRFGAGLGLGGAVPCFVALISEYAPAKQRGMIVGLLWAAFPLGAAVGALINSYIVGELGWRMLFYVWGAIPIGVAVLHVVMLPESVHLLIARSATSKRVAAILNRIEPGSAPADQTFVEKCPDTGTTSPLALFGPTFRVASWSLSLTAFVVFGLLTVGASWMPTLLTPYGFTPASGALVVAFNGFGSFVGTAGAGYLLGRFGIGRVLVPALVGTAASLAALGFVTGSFALVATASASAGVCLGIVTSSMLVLAATIYPTAIRSTGVGWTAGTGRFGSVATPLLVGALIGSGWSIVGIMVVLAVLAATAIPTVLILARQQNRREAETTSGPDHRPSLASAVR